MSVEFWGLFGTLFLIGVVVFFLRRATSRVALLETFTGQLNAQFQMLLPCSECSGVFVRRSMFYVGDNQTERVTRVVCAVCRRQLDRSKETIVGNVAKIEDEARQRAAESRAPKTAPKVKPILVVPPKGQGGVVKVTDNDEPTGASKLALIRGDDKPASS